MIVATLMADDVNSWQLGPDAVWRRTEEIQGQPGTVDTFAVMKEAAHQACRHDAASSTARPPSPADPWTREHDQAQRPVEVELKYRVVVRCRRRATAQRRRSSARFAVDGPVRTRGVRGPLRRHEGRCPWARGVRRPTATRTRLDDRQRQVAVARRRARCSVESEIEGPADRSLSPAEWPTSAARSFILEHCGDAPLLEVVTVRQTRRKRPLPRRRHGHRAQPRRRRGHRADAARRPVHRARVRADDGGRRSRSSRSGANLTAIRDLAPSRTSKFQAALAASKRKRGGRGHAGRDAAAGLVEDGATGGTTEADRNGDEARASSTADAGADTNAAANAEGPADGDGERRRAGDGETAVADDRGESGDTADRDATGAEAGADHAPATETSPDARAVASDGGDASTDAAAAASAGLTVGKTPGVTTDDVVAEAGRKVLRFHLARLIAREAGTRSGDDPEELHSMRVATRRMRAAWRVFGDGFRQDGTRRFRNRLRDVARKLGAVRDIDVLILALEEYRAALPDGGAEGARTAARRLARRTRRGPRRPGARTGLRRVSPVRRRLPRVRPHARGGLPQRLPDPAEPRARHRRIADLAGLRAGRRIRTGPALGRRADAPPAADRRQVAALHARVRGAKASAPTPSC